MTDSTSGEPPPPRPDGDAGIPSSVGRPPRRRRRRVGVVGLGLVAALGASTFAALSLSTTDGSATPQAAVERLLSAVGDEDVIGVLEALEPGERSVLRPGLQDVGEELRRLAIASEDFDLGAVSGVDLELDGVTMETEELSDGLAAVRITGGTITASTRPGELPVGSNLQRFLEHPDLGLELEPASTTEELAVDAPVLVALDEGDGWHVSLFYSVAEASRRSAGQPLPSFGQSVEPAGAESPEAAVSDALRAAAGLDVRRVLSLTDPREMRALHDYAPLFLDDVDAAVGDLRAGSFRIDVDRLDLDSEVSGDRASVQVSGLAVSGTAADRSRLSMSYDGDCWTVDLGEGRPERRCTSELESPGAPSFNRRIVLTAVRREGRWYVSPTGTVFEQVLASLRALERSDLEDPERFFGSGFGFGLAPFLGAPGVDDGSSPSGDPRSGEAPGPLTPGGPRPRPPALDEAPPQPSVVAPSVTAPPVDDEPVDCFAGYDDLPEDATQEDADRELREIEACLEEQGVTE